MEEQEDRDARFMRLALAEAEQAYAEGEIPVGAVIVAGGRVIARAHNQTETLHDVTAHAEMLAITAAADLLGGALRDVRRCHWLGADRAYRLWSRRRQAGLHPFSATCFPPESECDNGGARR